MSAHDPSASPPPATTTSLVPDLTGLGLAEALATAAWTGTSVNAAGPATDRWAPAREVSETTPSIHGPHTFGGAAQEYIRLGSSGAHSDHPRP